MMAHHNKHLQDLLQEDQEPFILKSYISDKRCQLKRPTPTPTRPPKTHQLIQLKKQKPNFSGKSLCKNACFFSFHDSPDVRKSPLFEFTPSPVPKSPCNKNSNSIFLHIPARTAAVLLEAASRIQKQSSSSSSSSSTKQHKTTQNKNPGGLGLFGSILKRLTNRSKTQKRKIGGDGVKVSVKEILRWDSSVGRRKLSGEAEKVQENLVVGLEDIISASEMGFSSCSCNGGRLSSAVWSESNEEEEEEKSLDTETSSSGNSDDSEETGDFAASSCHQKDFSKSPFRFVLHRSPPPDCRTPDFSSPATSPNRHNKEERENYGGERVTSFQQVEDHNAEEEEEKEQFSPVSVLDPLFEDDDDVQEDDDDDDDDNDHEGDFDLECSYAFVQRAKHQLLQKLRRFEQLAELDPIELEKRILEDEQEEQEEEEEECDVGESASFDRSKNADECIIREVLSKSSLKDLQRIPADVKRLVADLIAEEKREQKGYDDREEVVQKVCKRLDSLKEVESNTIDMMVEFDFRRELDGWKRNDQEQMKATAMEIELAIFGLLVEEVSEELVCLHGP